MGAKNPQILGGWPVRDTCPPKTVNWGGGGHPRHRAWGGPAEPVRGRRLPVEPDHFELRATVERVLAAVVLDPRRPGRHVLRVGRVDVVDLGRGMPLDIVDDLFPGRAGRVATLRIEEIGRA